MSEGTRKTIAIGHVLPGERPVPVTTREQAQAMAHARMLADMARAMDIVMYRQRMAPGWRN